MNISLSPDLEKLILDKLGDGTYASPSDVIREGLRLLTERDEHLRCQAVGEIPAVAAIRLDDDPLTEYDEVSVNRLIEAVRSGGKRSRKRKQKA